MLPITTTLAGDRKEKPTDDNKLGFGEIFTDHMFMCDYEAGVGWYNARIVPYAPLSVDPACAVLHYSQSIFEGMKCYRREDGELQLFRTRDNFERMNHSAMRLGMPKLDVDTFVEGLLQLLRVEKDWVPHLPGTSLYVRPTLIATDCKLSVHSSHSYLFFIILSPVGAYYKGGLAPNDIYIEDEYVRAVRGGIGETKAGANYAASLLAGVAATEKGFAQVLWLDGVERRYIEEVGSMNILFVYEGKKIVTPRLNGSILPGITRDSVMKLAKSFGYEVAEEKMDINQVLLDLESGKITESFGSGTAAVVSPIKSFSFRGKRYQVGDGGIGPVAQKLYDTLTGIQYGRLEDSMGWVVSV